MGVGGMNEGILIKHLRWACISYLLLLHRGFQFMRRGLSAERSVHQPVNVNSVPFFHVFASLFTTRIDSVNTAQVIIPRTPCQ